MKHIWKMRPVKIRTKFRSQKKDLSQELNLKIRIQI